MRWNDQGLVPAIAQDADNGDVLMLAWMNEAALRETLETGRACYWSRHDASGGRRGTHVVEIQEVRITATSVRVPLRVTQAMLHATQAVATASILRSGRPN